MLKEGERLFDAEVQSLNMFRRVLILLLFIETVYQSFKKWLNIWTLYEKKNKKKYALLKNLYWLILGKRKKFDVAKVMFLKLQMKLKLIHLPSLYTSIPLLFLMMPLNPIWSISTGSGQWADVYVLYTPRVMIICIFLYFHTAFNVV